MLKKVIALCMALLLPAAVLSGCSGDGEEAEPVYFSYPIDEMPQRLDSTVASTLAERTVIANCMEGLVRVDSAGNIVPGVAQTVNISDDGLRYEFQLRQDAKYHVFSSEEGEEAYFPEGFDNRVTAHDFVFALRRALDPAMGCPDAKRFYAIKNARQVNEGTLAVDQLAVYAQGDYTLVIELETATQDFLSLLTLSSAMPCNEQFFNSTGGRYGLELELMLYNGPYYLSRWDKDGSSVIIRKNNDYVGENEATSGGITLMIDDDEKNRYDNVSDGTYDATSLGAEYTAELSERTKMTVTRRENIVWGICVNTQDSTMAELNMRLALFYSIDPSLLIMPEEMTAQAYGVVPASCRSGGSSYREAAGQADLIAYDAAAAQNYWAQAKQAAGVSSVSLKLMCTEEFESQMRKLIQGCQSVFGISVSIGLESVDRTTFEKRLASGDYQIAFAPIRAESDSPAAFLAQFMGNAASGNIVQYHSDIYDDLAAQAMAGAGTHVIRRAESHLIQNGVIYPFYTQSTSFVQAKDVSGIFLSPIDGTPSFISAQRSD